MWSTHQRPEFHEGLVELAASFPRQQSLGDFPDLRLGGRRVRIVAVGAPSHQDTGNIAIHHGCGDVVGYRGDGPGRIPADTRQGHQILHLSGYDPAELGDDLLGGRVQVAGPAVIAKAGPQGQYFIQISGRQIGDRRITLHETLKIGDDGRHLGLLEHDLGQQLGIGILLTASPGQVALVTVIPSQQLSPEGPAQ